MTQTTATPTDRTLLGLLPAHVVGGVGGLLFVVVIVVQNLLRASAPSDGASPGKVIDFYASHGTTDSVLAVLFVLSGIGLVCFGAGLLDRLLVGRTRAPALLGALGLAGILCLFATMLAGELALARVVHAGVRDGSAVLVLWTLHNAAFTVLLFAIAVALAGLSVAATAAGLIEAAWRPVCMVGALLLAVCAALAPLVLDGKPVLVVGLVGFVVWLAFIVRSSVALLRG